MSFPRYEKYKDSGVEWLGEVPAHWGTVPLKHRADFINGDAFKPTDWVEAGVPIIRIQNLNGSEDFNYFGGEVEARYLVHDEDLLFGWSGNRGTSFGPFIWRKQEVCALNQHIFRVVPRRVEKRELYWMLKAVTAHVEDQAHGIIGMVHVTKGDLGAISVPIPPPAEQLAIATFLDHETAKIDALVEEQKRLIELLKEKRQTVISHAVTKGLNPNAPMKESGVEWLGEVPAHWGVVALKRLIAIGSSISYGIVQPGTPLDDGVPFVQTTNMTSGDFEVDSLQKTSPEIAATYPRSQLSGGEVILGIRASIGACHVVPTNLQGYNLSRGVARIVCNATITSEFLVSYLKTEPVHWYWQLAKQGSTFNEVSIETVRELQVVVPPPGEQGEIAQHAKSVEQRLDSLVAEAESAVALLQERRTALISAAVTGKIDVRRFSKQQALEAA